MPGGMGGAGGGILGGLLGSAVRGIGNGMQGMGPMNGRMQGNQMPVRTEDNINAGSYDLDRWKRADGMDAAATPTIQEVKDDWARKEKKKNKNIKKQEKENNAEYLNRTREQSIEELKEEKQRIEREASGTVFTPEMKKAARRIGGASEPERPALQMSGKDKQPYEVKKNYLGLEVESQIGEFFTSDPINSVILGVDMLSMEPLSLSQASSADYLCRSRQNGFFAAETNAEPLNPETQTPAYSQNRIADRVDTSHMKAFHEARKERKYDVKIL